MIEQVIQNSVAILTIGWIVTEAIRTNADFEIAKVRNPNSLKLLINAEKKKRGV